MKEALLYEKLDENRVRCNLCAHHCVIAEGKYGVCQVRQNENGRLYTLVYGRVISQHVDPIEKKPLYHFYPGSTAFSVATPGCNFRCDWCQNADISQMPRDRGTILGEYTLPETIVANARKTNSRSIAYTYTEPTIFYEYVYDVAALAHEIGIANVLVTNGYMTQEMLAHFRPYLNAANVDLKSFNNKIYRRYIGASLQPVLDSLKKMKEWGVWLEVTTLIVPGINDDLAELRELARFIAQELGTETPWHISRFFPHYRMQMTPRTPGDTMQKAKEIGKEEGLLHIYMGNVTGDSDTLCASCGELLIRRMGYMTAIVNLQQGKCARCQTPVAGVWTS